MPIDCVQVAWALDSRRSLEPLLIISIRNLLYVYDVRERKILSYLRGHGGTITSIVVHPTVTNLFCTTSRDYSTRIYDLHLTVQDPAKEQGPGNPGWPPGKGQSFAGAAHGLRMTEGEGSGIGRCIIVLVGGRSGGHQAAVLGAAFHPHLPLIATCGLDRLVKIWFIPPVSKDVLTREDKPLFSSGRIHRARVLSVSWVSNELYQDLLLTHSAPALLKMDPDNPNSKDMCQEPGQLIVWRWLSLDRFFPAAHEDGVRQTILRGCASDYQESCSFKVISAVSFPRVATQFITPVVHLHSSPYRDPLILIAYPNSNKIMIVNIVNLQPCKPPPFPLDNPEYSPGIGLLAIPRKHISEVPEVSGWEISIPCDSDSDEESLLRTCAMDMSGTIIAAGHKGTLWLWNNRNAVKT